MASIRQLVRLNTARENYVYCQAMARMFLHVTFFDNFPRWVAVREVVTRCVSNVGNTKATHKKAETCC